MSPIIEAFIRFKHDLLKEGYEVTGVRVTDFPLLVRDVTDHFRPTSICDTHQRIIDILVEPDNSRGWSDEPR